MSNIAEAVAKLGLDTQGFDNNAERSFKRFAKQLEGVKDATDAAMRGAEALERMFVKSLAGVAVVGAANVLSDAMRDVGNKIGGAGDAAADAMSSMKGLASSMEEGYARAEKLNAAAVTVKKTLEEIKNSGPINQAVFAAFGGEGVLQNLEQSLRGGSQAEVLGAAVNARNRARDTAGMTPEQIKNYDLQKQRAAEISRIRQAGGDTAAPTIKALEEKYALEDAAKASEEARQTALGRMPKNEAEARRQADLEVGEIAKARESERNRAEAQRGLEEARRQVAEKQIAQEKVKEEKRLENLRNFTRASRENDALRQRERDVEDSFGGMALESSRRGVQYLDRARRTQATRRRLDDFKFGDEQVQKFVDRMRTRGSGQTAEEFERYSGMSDDMAREAARRDLAAKRAEQENPTLRAQRDKSLGDVYTLLEKNLNELKTYAHVT